VPERLTAPRSGVRHTLAFRVPEQVGHEYLRKNEPDPTDQT
jgi:hypothetical protein